jgi:hypothetical protein
MTKPGNPAKYPTPIHIDSVGTSEFGLEDTTPYRIAFEVNASNEYWKQSIMDRCIARLLEAGFTIDPDACTRLHVYLTEGSGFGLSAASYYDVMCSKDMLFRTRIGWSHTRAVVWARRSFRFFKNTLIGYGPHLREIPNPLIGEFLLDYHRAN